VAEEGKCLTPCKREGKLSRGTAQAEYIRGNARIPSGQPLEQLWLGLGLGLGLGLRLGSRFRLGFCGGCSVGFLSGGVNVRDSSET